MHRHLTLFASIAALAPGPAIGFVPAASASGPNMGCQPTATTSTTTIPVPTGNPLNNDTVENCDGGTIEARSKLQLASARGRSAEPVNFAYAYAHDCSTGCKAIAAALQVALVDQGTHSQTPQNVAVAINLRCNSCGAFAYAYQYVVKVPKGTRLSSETQRQIQTIRHQADADVNANLNFAELDTRLASLAARLRAAVDEGLQDQNVTAGNKHSKERLKESGQY